MTLPLQGISGAVYSPPSPDMPFIAVVFRDQAVIVARTVKTSDDGEAVLAALFSELAGDPAEGNTALR